MRKKKGFTLMELTIVLAIIGILMAIVVPSWGYYLQRSRLRAQNHNAKIVYNAAQRIVTDLEFYERQYLANLEAAGSDVSLQNAVKEHFYTPSPETPANNVWYFYCGNGFHGRANEDASAVLFDGNANTVENRVFTKWNAEIHDTVSRIAGEDVCYKIRVDNYTVTAVVTANSEDDFYLGSYPITLETRRNRGTMTRQEVAAVRRSHIRGATMDQFTAAGNGIDYTSS